MDVLITGATGFIGKHLVRFLMRQSGLELWCISRNGGQVDSVHVDSVDLTSAEKVAEWRKDKPVFDTIFHLAASIPSSFKSSEADESFLDNIYMMQNTIAIAIPDNSSIIYTSSSSVYCTENTIPLTEDLIPQPNNPYSLSKYVGELLLDIAHIRYGLSTSSLRVSAPYGPYQKARTVINIFLRAVFESRNITLYGSGNRTQDFTYVDDVLQAIWLAFQKKASGVYNIASGNSITMSELAKTVLSVEQESKSRIIYSDTADSQENYRVEYSIEKALNILHYAPRTSLTKGLQHCLDAMKVGG